jgi:hypothetical protein
VPSDGLNRTICPMYGRGSKNICKYKARSWEILQCHRIGRKGVILAVPFSEDRGYL